MEVIEGIFTVIGVIAAFVVFPVIGTFIYWIVKFLREGDGLG